MDLATLMDCGTDPAGWIVRGGRPARALRFGGMPSFEHEDGRLWVFDLLRVQVGADGQCRLWSSWYGTACVLAPDGMVPLHHHEGAWWQWRPRLYRHNAFWGWMGLGSQEELQWRYGLGKAIEAAHFGEPELLEQIQEADARASRLLAANLSPQQRIELAALGHFHTRGGRTRNLYKVGLGDGFAIVDHRTQDEAVSYCLHTEHWMPSADIALATKLALEDPEMEIECLENARPTLVPPERRATADDLVCAMLERDLHPPVRELVLA